MEDIIRAAEIKAQIAVLSAEILEHQAIKDGCELLIGILENAKTENENVLNSKMEEIESRANKLSDYNRFKLSTKNEAASILFGNTYEEICSDFSDSTKQLENRYFEEESSINSLNAQINDLENELRTLG